LFHPVSPDYSSTMAKVGDRVGSYVITGVIGRGAMATVYRAHDERLNRDVALKLLDPAYAQDFIYRARFEREYRVTAMLKNDHIVPIYDGGSWDDQLYIAMMLVDGPNLAEIMKQDGPLELARVVSIVAQLADALDDAHGQRLIHRDVKPANVLVIRHGPDAPEHVYLADFGLTLGMEGTHLTRTGGFMGTLAYTAPEQLNSAPIDGRADEYALAATTFQMLTTEMPFQRDNEMALINAQLFDPPPKVTDLRPDLPPRLNAVVARGMAKKPEDRYPTVGAFAKALASASPRVALVPAAMVAGGVPQGGNRAGTVAVILGLIGAVVLGALITYAAISFVSPALAPSPDSSPTGSGAPPSNLVAVASPTFAAPSAPVTPVASAGSSPGPSAGPDKSPRATPKAPPPTIPTPPPTTPPSTPTPSAPPTPTPTPPTDLPLVAEGTWSVDNSPSGLSGSPYVVVGEHRRRYVLASRCESETSCRLFVNTFDAESGNRLGTIVFKWNGSSYDYRGSASWYRSDGGAKCQTSSGDLVDDAYNTHEEVHVAPAQPGGGTAATQMSGTKTISGTPTAAGSAAGCAPFEMTYTVAMNAT
jgi:serine/threonine protein kinase